MLVRFKILLEISLESHNFRRSIMFTKDTESFDIDRLLLISNKIDGAGYGASKNLLGIYKYDEGITLAIDRVPRDPSDPLPGKLRIFIPFDFLRYNKDTITKDRHGILAAKHFFTEQSYRTLRYEGRPWLWIDPPGQAVLDRTSVEIFEEGIELQIDFIPPFKSRRKLSGGRLRRLFSDTIPRIINELKATNKKRQILQKIRDTLEDQEYLRKLLKEENYIAFIADGSILPRRGETDFPMPNAIPFKAPDKYTVEFELRNHGVISGLAIPAGKVVVFAGANFHGKTTILEALAVAHYNHIPGDGREFVISVDELPLITVENRRIVRGVDISSFMKTLPGSVDTHNFTTENASGSTSQAASLIEAIESRVPGILIDEDSSAVNFLLRDHLLQRIIPSDLEPITPLIDMLPAIKKKGISLIFAIGALGDFLRVSDTIFLVSHYKISEIFAQGRVDLIKKAEEDLALGVAEPSKIRINKFEANLAHDNISTKQDKRKHLHIKHRVPLSGTIPDGKIKKASYEEIIISWRGRSISINLRGAIRKTLKEKAQVRALAFAIVYASKYADGKTPLSDIVDKVMTDIRNYGLNVINPYKDEVPLNLASFTKYQLFYSLSRLPTLKIKS